MNKIKFLVALALFATGPRYLFADSDILAEGKTKIVRRCPHDPDMVIIESKDDITAFNKEKHDLIEHKAEYTTDTACNVFRLLQDCGVPVAFVEQLDGTRFLAPHCQMIELEVVVRRESHGSYAKRNPHLPHEHVFPNSIIEFFLKTSDHNWHGLHVPEDDPLIQFEDGKACLYLPKKPVYDQEPFAVLSEFPCSDQPELLNQMASLARYAFLVLEKAWQPLGGRLVDFKVEFGIDVRGNLLLADVISNDEWRVVRDGSYLDKQFYRDGGNLNEVTARYRRVRDLTGQFGMPRQRVIVWCGSSSDDITPFKEMFELFLGANVDLVHVVNSMHKNPAQGYDGLYRLVQEVPDAVVIAYIGRSNGAGPALSSLTHVPVITVPADYRQFPDDVWSALRAPSEAPVMTVLEPANALLAALQILAQRNPCLYAQLRMRQEDRLVNCLLF